MGNTNGIFLASEGKQVDHDPNRRTIALGFEDLMKIPVVLLIAGQEKPAAAKGLLKNGVVNGLIIDGDAAEALVVIG